MKRTESVIPDNNRAASLILGREEKDKDFIFINRVGLGFRKAKHVAPGPCEPQDRAGDLCLGQHL